MSKIKLLQGDCLELMKDIPDKSIDVILCDLPYGTTYNDWDSVIDLDRIWAEYKRIIIDRGAIVLFAQSPFDKILGASNLKMLKYEWIWVKSCPTGFLNCHNAPLKIHENILVFSKSPASMAKNVESMKYNPQYIKGKPYKAIHTSMSTNYNRLKKVITINDGNYYPIDVLEFKSDKEKLHPTQKPVALCQYLIKTYSDEGDTILDNCMGSGTTGVACKNLNRNFIGMELNEEYFKIAEQRINNGFVQKELSNDELNSLPLFL